MLELSEDEKERLSKLGRNEWMKAMETLTLKAITEARKQAKSAKHG